MSAPTSAAAAPAAVVTSVEIGKQPEASAAITATVAAAPAPEPPAPEAPAPPPPPEAPSAPIDAPPAPSAPISESTCGGSAGQPAVMNAKPKRKLPVFGAAAARENDAKGETVDPFANLLTKTTSRYSKGETPDLDPAMLERLAKESAALNIQRFTCPRCEQLVDVSQAESHASSHSSIILPDLLYLGGLRNAHNRKELLERTGVTHVLNVTEEINNFFPDKAKYLKLCVHDLPEQNLKEYFPDICRFIDEARTSGGRVLVHCVQGVSRSSTMTIAYVMWHKRWPLKEAHAHVLKQRTVIRPNTGFWKQLNEWEKELGLGDGTTPHPDTLLASSSIVIGRKLKGTEEDQKAALAKQHDDDYEAVQKQLRESVLRRTIESVVAARHEKELAYVEREHGFDRRRFLQEERDKGLDAKRAEENFDAKYKLVHTQQLTILRRTHADEVLALYRRYFPETQVSIEQYNTWKAQSRAAAAAATATATATASATTATAAAAPASASVTVTVTNTPAATTSSAASTNASAGSVQILPTTASTTAPAPVVASATTATAAIAPAVQTPPPSTMLRAVSDEIAPSPVNKR